MNCIDLFVRHVTEAPSAPALWMPNGELTTFQELSNGAAEAQVLCRRNSIGQGDAVLLFDMPSPRMYAAVIGIMGLGATVVLVEPWMPLALIEKAISLAKPKLFLTNLLGMAWGMRVQQIRAIPRWKLVRDFRTGRQPLLFEAVPSNSPAILTFTTGTTGHPKGVVRTHAFLQHQHEIISKHLGSERFSGPDLCLFPNFALTNLASGRCSLLVPRKWDRGFFSKVAGLTPELRPQTLTCGPAFLQKLLEAQVDLPLSSIHVGGALCDCSFFEKGFERWPHAIWKHVYGSTEAEPVSLADAHVAVKESRAAGYYQTLYVGHPIEEIRTAFEAETLWVSGSHVSSYYLGDDEANRTHKKVDSAGCVWHSMGDRIVVTESGWWYHGRSRQPHHEFLLEQQIYAWLGTSHAFVASDQDKRLFLFGEAVEHKSKLLLKQFPQLSGVFNMTVYRDKRHRARIDRALSLQKGAPWIVG